MPIKKLIEQLKKLTLPSGEYAVFGSAVMAVRGIRESPNIDVIVTNKLWQKLTSSDYVPDSEGFIRTKQIKISNWWFAPTRKDILTMIKEAELIEEIPFVKLDEVRSYKKTLNREKDKLDVTLIDKYLEDNKSGNPTCLGHQDYREIIDYFISEVGKKIPNAILSMILFGSASRNQAKGDSDSDIDIFVFYDQSVEKRENIINKLNSILFETRDTDTYKKLENKNIFPEIYPFLISKENSDRLPWVIFDSLLDGKILFDKKNFGEKVTNSFKEKILKNGGRRVSLANNKWCWILYKNFSQVLDGMIRDMGNDVRAKMLIVAAKESLAEAEFSSKRGVFNLVVRRTQEAVELDLKGALALMGIDHPKDHDQAPLLASVFEANGYDLGDKRKFIEEVSIDLSRKRGPALQQDEGYGEEVALKAISDAKEVLSIIDKVVEKISASIKEV